MKDKGVWVEQTLVGNWTLETWAHVDATQSGFLYWW